MSKILITGMTASQASFRAHTRDPSFAGLIYDTLNSLGHEVDLADPRIDQPIEYYEKYDRVLVGVAPVTSLAANRAYGALSIINTLWNWEGLTLFVDAPFPIQIGQSLRSVTRNPESLFKPFYSYRKGYQDVYSSATQARIFEAVSHLLNDPWPRTLYPTLPWGVKSPAEVLPESAGREFDNFFGLNLDSTLGEIKGPTGAVERNVVWRSDYPNSVWTKEVANTLEHEIKNMKPMRNSSALDVYATLVSSMGALVSPQRTGETWWTFRFAQALHAGTPIVTEWRDSQRIHSSWSVLGAQVEEMNDYYRGLLSQEQRESYLDAIPTKQEVQHQLQALLDVDMKVRT